MIAEVHKETLQKIVRDPAVGAALKAFANSQSDYWLNRCAVETSKQITSMDDVLAAHMKAYDASIRFAIYGDLVSDIERESR